MNRVFSVKEPKIVSGNDMEAGDFGVVVEVLGNGRIKVNENVYRIHELLIRLNDGFASDQIGMYNVKLQDSITIQRIK